MYSQHGVQCTVSIDRRIAPCPRSTRLVKIAGTDRSVALKDVVAASFDDTKRPDGVEAGLRMSENWNPSGATFPNGCHVCEVDVDADTGEVEFVRYTIQDDLGVAVNPLTMAGQIYGGAVQGLGQAMFEEAIYDESGQLVTGSFMDYCMPRADNTPSFDFAYTEVPTPRNALGAKGAGEGGIIPVGGAVANAVSSALKSFGVQPNHLPLSPNRVWSLVQDAKQ